ncbi:MULTISPECIES: carbohydrate kinase [unclassified Pseudophaeobacter]|uniref:carbohydrate kinase family protein n=1 Tax=unclassified Pseudophaeobacter TaxID=2637024 RepID=UPI000EFA3B24|nr:carbohydrate kinase [Pseudophaeobacter sp. EL27]
MILCCGEALMDMIPTVTPLGREAYEPRPGGAVLNTAVAMGRLGAPAGMVTGLSHDMFGRKLAEHLSGSNVDISYVLWSDRPTTLAFVELENGQASYQFYDENSAARMLKLAEIPPLPTDVSALFFGGISLACEPAADSYAALMAREGRGCAVMLDPNIRPSFIQNIERYRQRLDRMLQLSDIVKVSDEDLNWIFPEPGELEGKVQYILQKGVSVVVLTCGEKGATGFLANGTRVHVPAMLAEIADTVGAGDTFNAGFLTKLSEQGSLSKDRLKSLAPRALKQALKHGTRAAGVTVTRVGADPPWAREI